ncbi:MAG: hypothetical protein R2851_19170 [Caldilineaceae bacterium]
MVGTVTPGFFGRACAALGLWDRVETPFVGVTTLLALGASFSHRSTRRAVVAVGGRGALRAAGRAGVYAVVHGWLTVLLPGFAAFRAPARAIVLWAFALSVLGGMGLDQVVRSFDAARGRR